jgi:hypothetical protein
MRSSLKSKGRSFLGRRSGSESTNPRSKTPTDFRSPWNLKVVPGRFGSRFYFAKRRPGMVRWLEVTNTGQRLTAISNVSPWSGELWHTPNFAEKLQPDSEDVYDVVYAQYSKWGTKARGASIRSSTSPRLFPENAASLDGATRHFSPANNATGEWFVASLGWRANWKIRVTSKVEQSPVDRSDAIGRPVNEARLFFRHEPQFGRPSPATDRAGRDGQDSGNSHPLHKVGSGPCNSGASESRAPLCSAASTFGTCLRCRSKPSRLYRRSRN